MYEIFIVIAGIFFFIYMIKRDKQNCKKIDERNRKIDEKYEVQEEEILAEKETSNFGTNETDLPIFKFVHNSLNLQELHS